MRPTKSAIMFISCIALLLCVTLAARVDRAGAGKLNLELHFCHFSLPEKVKEMNASFSIVYSFRIGEDGQPCEIMQVRDRYVGKDVVASCLENWRLTGLDKKSNYFFAANWKHGIGWVEMSIVGRDFNQRIGRHGDLGPYSGCQGPEPPDA
ncbi:MAG: hypothetical protein GY847_28145 [Proteobacteria bacterium]|nr:hypothetical protein [Pseudomonadota bacterium]